MRILMVFLALVATQSALAAPRGKAAPAASKPRVSAATQECLDCHADATPGIVAEWRASRHAGVTVAEALARTPLERRVSVAAAPEGTGAVVVGCAECHAARPDAHPDSFDHEGHRVHTVVSPPDCASCHPVEAGEFDQNIMSRAYGNLMGNPLFKDMSDQVLGIAAFDPARMTMTMTAPAGDAQADSCLSCHGTIVQVTGTTVRHTDVGDLTFPVLSNWPNQGVGRMNPDGSRGACSACHTRHAFSIAVARSAETCATCHKGPDVPAYAVWSVSKHGTIVKANSDKWDMTKVPWTVGNDFTAPTCAACHASLVVAPGGAVIAPRTHRMNDRLPWRLFGLPYSHPHPVSPDTTILRTAGGLPLPTDLDGTLSPGLIDAAEQGRRTAALQKVCRACHGQGWIDGHFARLQSTLREADAQTLAATGVVRQAWARGLAKGPGKGSIFDEPIERSWVEGWLFYGNSTRFASAMAGADYGTFANGRWMLAKNLRDMMEWLADRLSPARR
jgi:hypothetical protein